MAQAIASFGVEPDAVLHGGSCPDDILGYCEVHIEQGPVLEHINLPIGIVSAISGQNRFNLRFTGMAGHAGTVPMEMRRDALAAASEFIVAAETLAKQAPGLVATVGQIHARPGASNVIPGEVTISLDVRHIEDPLREEACAEMKRAASEICSRRGIDLHWHPVQETASVPCEPTLSAQIARAVENAGYPAYFLPSGAGHDAVTMSRICPVAMLFVRCKGGISHNPAESVEVEDVAVAIDALTNVLLSVDADWSTGHD
jgi:allantoate deiminase